jgi:hypothetical protein
LCCVYNPLSFNKDESQPKASIRILKKKAKNGQILGNGNSIQKRGGYIKSILKENVNQSFLFQKHFKNKVRVISDGKLDELDVLLF